ncbi:MAG: hypothetical protein EOP50_04350, partial [Sphingobacteriales bacterium]
MSKLMKTGEGISRRDWREIGVSSRTTGLGFSRERISSVLITIVFLAALLLAESRGQTLLPQQPRRVAGGYYHSVMLEPDGTIWASGQNNYGQLGDGTLVYRNVPVQVKAANGQPLTGIVAVSAHVYYTIALSREGTVWGWGNNSGGQLGDGTITSRQVPMRILEANGQPLTQVVAVAAGYLHCIALKADGTVWAWGQNAYGQVGDGTMTNRHRAVQVKNADSSMLSNVRAISAGMYASYAVKDDGSVWAWGQNIYGQLGDGTGTNRSTPVRTKDGNGPTGGVVNVASFGNHCLALKQDGTVWAWGLGAGGQLGDGTTVSRNLAVQVKDQYGPISGVAAIAVGNLHSIAVTLNGTVWAWGQNSNGQLGIGSTTYKTTATHVGNTGRIVEVACGLYHSVALSYDGALTAWGYNVYGQLGDGTTTQRIAPTQVSGFYGASIAAGQQHSLVVTRAGTVWGWGNNLDGQLGDRTNNNYRYAPVQAMNASGTPLTDVRAVSGGDLHSVAVTRGGAVWAWGYNTSGQLGDGTTTSRSSAVQAKDITGAYLSGVVAVSGGRYHTLALRQQDGKVWAWGSNAQSQLGNGVSGSVSMTAGLVKDWFGSSSELSSVIAVSAGSYHNLALKQDGTVWAWGLNNNGQLGDGTYTNRTTAVPVQQTVQTSGSVLTALTDVVAIAAGDSHSVALKRDGSVWVWGNNSQGQLGDETTTQQVAAVQVGSISGVTLIAADRACTLAIKADGTAWAWGEYESGVFGNRPIRVAGLDGATAVAAGDDHL